MFHLVGAKDMARGPIDDGGSAPYEHEHHEDSVLHDGRPQPPGDGREVEVSVLLTWTRMMRQSPAQSVQCLSPVPSSRDSDPHGKANCTPGGGRGLE